MKEDGQAYPDTRGVEENGQVYPDTRGMKEDEQAYPDTQGVKEDGQAYPDTRGVKEDGQACPDTRGVKDGQAYPDTRGVKEDGQAYPDTRGVKEDRQAYSRFSPTRLKDLDQRTLRWVSKGTPLSHLSSHSARPGRGPTIISTTSTATVLCLQLQVSTAGQTRDTALSLRLGIPCNSQ